MANPTQPHPQQRLPKPRRRWLRIILYSLAGLAAVVLVAALSLVLWLRSATRAALATLDGDLRVPGLGAPVLVRRDAHGTPHIDAATQDDLWFAQGYVTAQDRLWQMDMLRRSATGELAEVLGPSMAGRDTEQRVLQFRRTAERVYAALTPADRSRLDAYARGVNAFIAQHRESLPPEFGLLMYKPRPWQGADSLSIGMNMVEMLDSHWEDKLSRERIAQKLNDPKLEADLYPVGSWRDHPPTGELHPIPQPVPAPPPPAKSSDEEDDDEDDRYQAALRSQPSLTQPSLTQPQTLGAPGLDFESWESTTANQPQETPTPATRETPGSNNWVVSGAHTASGLPLLANDMHLGLMEPNIWYMADLRAPGYHAAGVTFPGVPFVIAGHNDHVAWGFTALYADVQDLYIEKLDGKGNYEGQDAQWHPLQHDRETIRVRGGKDLTLDIQIAEHGPLLNPILRHESRPIALKWTLYDPGLNGMPLYEMNTAANWAEFHSAIAQWCWPTQNLVYSDDQGHIAYHAVGRVPVRGGGHGIFDKPMPRDGRDLGAAWGYGFCAGLCPLYIPFDDMPNSVDPPSGFLATANARVTTAKSPFPITHEWVDPYRAERIYKLLEGRERLTPADMLAVQTDVYSEVDQELAHRFSTAIDHTRPDNAQLRQAADLLRNWDGRMTADSPAASIVLQTRRALWPLLLKPKLGPLAGEYSWAESNFAEEEIVMHAPAGWLPAVYKNWDELLTDAVREGLKDGKAPADLTRWPLGSWHVVEIDHPLAAYLPLIGRMASTGPAPLAGDTTTVKQVGRSFGPSQRFIMDWSNIDGSTENIVLGQSGNPLSPYYRDQWNDYYGGTTFPLPFTEGAVAAQTRHTLRLLP